MSVAHQDFASVGVVGLVGVVGFSDFCKKKDKNLELSSKCRIFVRKIANMTDLSIIIPVYQVEKYIRACVSSVFRQGLDESRFEVIIVNDGTKDRSMEQICDIIGDHRNISVINQENQGLSVARNNGMALAKGEYILLIDSDDMLVDGSLSRILEIALEKKPDLITADFIRMEEGSNEPLNKIPFPEIIEIQEERGTNIFIKELNPYECYVWRTLYKRSFMEKNHVCFIPHICYEDIPFTHECYLKANTYIRVHIPIYIYITRAESITHTINKERCLDYSTVISKLCKLKTDGRLPENVLNQLEHNIYLFFHHLFYWFAYCIHDANDREQICDYLHDNIPDLTMRQNFSQKINTFCFRYFPHFYVHARYYFGRLVYIKLRRLCRF